MENHLDTSILPWSIPRPRVAGQAIISLPVPPGNMPGGESQLDQVLAGAKSVRITIPAVYQVSSTIRTAFSLQSSTSAAQVNRAETRMRLDADRRKHFHGTR
jgi:hypothetical protein